MELCLPLHKAKNKQKTPVDHPGFVIKRKMRAFLFLFFFQDGRQAFKFKMATNCSVQNDWQLFIYSYPTSKLNQNIHSMYFVNACSFQLHFYFNKAQMNTIMPNLKVLKIHQRGNLYDMHRAHQSHYFYCLKTSRIGSMHSGNIGWVSDQFHNTHGSVLMGLRRLHSSHIAN